MEKRGMRKVLTGKIVSDKMDKTVVVAVESLVRHPLYQRTIRRTLIRLLQKIYRDT